MHEISFAKAVISSIKDPFDVLEIEIELGELALITKQELINALSSMVDWKVNIKEIHSEIKCDCGYQGSAEIKERGHHALIYVCPECGEVPKVLSGDSIKIVKVKYKD